MEHVPNKDEYYISFDTQIERGKIVAVRIRLDQVTISNMDAPMKINLCDHPLYKDLKRYVKGNP